MSHEFLHQDLGTRHDHLPRMTAGRKPIRGDLGILAIVLVAGVLAGCQELVPHDPRSVLFARFHRSEIFGFLAGLGTTFAAAPDLFAMLKRRSSAGMNPRMATIMAMFQVLWVYYGYLIASRPVIMWNVIAVCVNALSVAAYRHFVRLERQPR